MEVLTKPEPALESEVPAPLVVTRGERVRSILFVFASAVSLFVLSWMIGGWDWAVGLLVLAIFAITIGGKLTVFATFWTGDTIFGGSYVVPYYSPYVLGTVVFYLDSVVAVLMAYNFDLMLKIPVVGEKIRAAQAGARSFLERRPWFRKLAYSGIVAFVFFPISGTGAIFGSILGNMLGISRYLLIFLIMLGGAIGGYGFALGADLFGEKFELMIEHPIFHVVGLCLLGAFGAWIVLRILRSVRPVKQAPPTS